MNPSTRPDENYFSFTRADQDAGLSIVRDLSACIGANFATVLKISDGAHDLDHDGLIVPAGNETAVDLDWAKNVRLRGAFAVSGPQPDNVLRLKGPFRNCAFSGFLYQRGKRDGIDIEIGNHFDQHPGLGSGWDLTDIEPHKNGERVTFAVGWVVPFTGRYKRGNCEYLIWQSLRLKAYVGTKHLLRWILRIPAGVKGPSWF